MLLLLNFLDVLVEPVEALVPELLETADPLVYRPKTARIEAIEPLLSVTSDTYEPDLTQHAQVLRSAGLRDAQRASQLVDRSLPSLKELKDPAPLWLGHGVERI
ncbi:MAG TPA: hypothetical protein VFH14_09220 [Gemmatimonadaceae bacterium]|nr:hypothetical protein [Gemmatimonadaceae bacterium]